MGSGHTSRLQTSGKPSVCPSVLGRGWAAGSAGSGRDEGLQIRKLPPRVVDEMIPRTSELSALPGKSTRSPLSTPWASRLLCGLTFL